MHYRDDVKSSRERIVAREMMKLELRQARARSAGRTEDPGAGRRQERQVVPGPAADAQAGT